MPDAKTSETQTKARFVRSLPRTMSAAELVEKGNAAGVKLTTHYVHKVRAKRGASKAKKKSTSGKTTTPWTSKKAKSAASFVRGLPASTPAKQVVSLAKAAGIQLGISYVYNIRGAAKLAAKKKRAAAKNTAVTVASGGGAKVPVSAEDLLKALGAELGLGKAIEILSGERARFRGVIAG
jgi:hypothetical protein